MQAFNEYKPVRHLQKEEMTGHRACAAGVFETAYGEGSRTVVNYNACPVEVEGLRVPALGYVLVNPDGTKRSFAFDGKAGLAEVK